MNDKELYKIFEQMKNQLGADELLNDLYAAMTTDEAEANLRYINDQRDLNLF